MHSSPDGFKRVLLRVGHERVHRWEKGTAHARNHHGCALRHETSGLPISRAVSRLAQRRPKETYSTPGGLAQRRARAKRGSDVPPGIENGTRLFTMRAEVRVFAVHANRAE